MPLWLGTLKEVTGSYRTGLWMFAVATDIVRGTVLVAERLARRIIKLMAAAGRLSH